MARAYDPARATRERLLMLERREAARAEARAVADGVAETVALARARGAAIVKPGQSERDAPYRRRTGLQFLLAKGRITPAQAAAGERYGEAFRRAEAAPALGSTLEVQPGWSDAGGPPLARVLRQAQRRQAARERLETCRLLLLRQADLVAACDLCCGRELTPREAAGAERDAARLEAVLKVALDILAAG